METKNLAKELSKTSYPGRGIILGLSEDGKNAIAAYFIMGRSENSRNRVFVEDGEGLRTEAFDSAKLKDPSLIIYSPVRVLKSENNIKTIVTNGDQTDTIFDGLSKGLTFEQTLRSREYEPDEPNFTPRISGVITQKDKNASFEFSILKHGEIACERHTYTYDGFCKGSGRFIHTYLDDGNPLPSFCGEPISVELKGDINELSEQIWKNLDSDNKVSLFVRFIPLAEGKSETRIINKNVR